MHFQMKMIYQLSSDFPLDRKDELSEIIAQCTSVLHKGVSEIDQETSTKISSWDISGSSLEFQFTAGATRVSPHHAILRLRNYLKTALGEHFRLGLRGFEILEYTIVVPLDFPTNAPFKLPFTQEIVFNEKEATITIDPSIPEDLLEKGAIDRIIRLVNDKIHHQRYGSKAEHHRIIFNSPQKEEVCCSDPTELMVKANWLKRAAHRNQWIITPTLTTLTEAIKNIMVDYLYKPLGFDQMIIPKLVPWDVWKRSGHAQGIFQGGFEPYFVVAPQTADPKFWEEVADYVKITKEIPRELIASKIRPPLGGLSFAQCPPFYWWLKGETIPDDTFPIKIFDWSGPTYRYESGSAYGFERVDELHRIETLFVGFPEQVIELGAQIRDKLLLIFNEILDLEVRGSYVTPWWQTHSGEIKEEKADSKVPTVGTIDFEAFMPYRGNRKESDWLEIQNISVIGSKYPKSFNIKSQSGDQLWSGCGGGSFERFLTAFIAQKGTDISKWPETFLKYVDKLPKPIHFL
ncbi:MAG: serine--tRNA ligase [Candidatus Kariarchaeaceae archaeon]